MLASCVAHQPTYKLKKFIVLINKFYINLDLTKLASLSRCLNDSRFCYYSYLISLVGGVACEGSAHTPLNTNLTLNTNKQYKCNYTYIYGSMSSSSSNCIRIRCSACLAAFLRTLSLLVTTLLCCSSSTRFPI